MSIKSSDRVPNTDPAIDCKKAILLGIAFLTTGNIDTTQLKLISADNLIKGSAHVGPGLWRLTFKPKRLIPEKTDAEVGAGGEIFIEIDLVLNKAKVIGYGE